MKFIFRLFIIYVLLVALAFVMSVCVHMLPRQTIKEHVRQSLPVFYKEGVYDTRIPDFILFRLDNFTDIIMLTLATSSDGERPIEDAMLNYEIKGEGDGIISRLEKAGTLDVIDRNNMSEYSRYWHGYLFFLKPLLYCFNYKQIRVLNYCVFFSLLCLLLWLLYKRFGKGISLIWGIVLSLCNVFMIPLSLQFSTIFYIAIISSIILLLFPRNIESTTRVLQTFFIIGATTSYFDLLTAPIVTLGLPMIIWALQKSNNNLGYKVLSKIVAIGFVWALGYSLMWSSKWIIGTLVTDRNLFLSAMMQADTYTGGNSVSSEWLGVFKSLCLGNLFTTVLFCSCLAIALCSLVIYIIKQDSQKIKQNLIFIFIALIPIAWMCILNTHTIIHFWFSWRNLIVSILCLSIFVYITNRNHSLSKEEI